MSKSIVALTVSALLTAILTIWAEYFGPAWMLYLCKPFTMLFIISIVVSTPNFRVDKYSRILSIGLIFCLLGDILLMLPYDLFKFGLLSFLVGHIFYILAFLEGRLKQQGWTTILPWLVYGVLVFLFLQPYLGNLLIPVLIYIIIILVMGWQARERWIQINDRLALLAFFGASLFIVSDTIHALHRFREPFALGRLVTLATYFSAQFLLALSTRKTD